MAANVRIQLNHPAVRSILRSDRVMRDLQKRANAIAAKAGPGHEVDTRIGRNRDRATVRTSHPVGASGRANLKNAISAGRG